MADKYLLELALPPVNVDGYLLEDGSGVLLLESQPATKFDLIEYNVLGVSMYNGLINTRI